MHSIILSFKRVVGAGCWEMRTQSIKIKVPILRGIVGLSARSCQKLGPDTKALSPEEANDLRKQVSAPTRTLFVCAHKAGPLPRNTHEQAEVTPAFDCWWQ